MQTRRRASLQDLGRTRRAARGSARQRLAHPPRTLHTLDDAPHRLEDAPPRLDPVAACSEQRIAVARGSAAGPCARRLLHSPPVRARRAWAGGVANAAELLVVRAARGRVESIRAWMVARSRQRQAAALRGCACQPACTAARSLWRGGPALPSALAGCSPGQALHGCEASQPASSCMRQLNTQNEGRQEQRVVQTALTRACPRACRTRTRGSASYRRCRLCRHRAARSPWLVISFRVIVDSATRAYRPMSPKRARPP